MCCGMLECCQAAVKDALKGISVLTALGGLAALLGGLHALLPLGAAVAADPSVSWFAWVLCVAGGLMLALGIAAVAGSWCRLAGPLHCVSGGGGGGRAVRAAVPAVPRMLCCRRRLRTCDPPTRAPTSQFTGAALALLPLQVLLVWAYVAHPSELRRLADRDQTYALAGILDWCNAHRSLAAGLAGLWLLLQAGAAVLGSVHACCPGAPRPRHPW